MSIEEKRYYSIHFEGKGFTYTPGPKKESSARFTLKKIERVFKECNPSEDEKKELREIARKIHTGYRAKIKRITCPIRRFIFGIAQREAGEERTYDAIERHFDTKEVFKGLGNKDVKALVMSWLPAKDIAVVARTGKDGKQLAKAANLALAKEYGYEEESQQEPSEYLKNLFAGIRALTAARLLPAECIAQDPEATFRKLIHLTEIEKQSFQSTWNTALLKSARQGFIEAAKQLITFGANVDARDNFENTPLIFATANKDLKMVQMLLAKHADPKQKLLFASWNSPEIARLLIESGAELDAKALDGLTVLHWAADEGSYEMADLLLSKGAAVDNMSNPDQKTPLHFSVRHPRVTALLLQNNASVDAVTTDQETTLFLAARCGQTETIALLLSAGATLELANAWGMTPLLAAARNAHVEATKLLIEKRAKVDHCSHAQNSALHHAARGRSKEVAQALIDAGSPVSVANQLGNTPLHFAITSGCSFDFIELLLDNGADPQAKNSDGKTPLDLAAGQFLPEWLVERLT